MAKKAKKKAKGKVAVDKTEAPKRKYTKRKRKYARRANATKAGSGLSAQARSLAESLLAFAGTLS